MKKVFYSLKQTALAGLIFFAGIGGVHSGQVCPNTVCFSSQQAKSQFELENSCTFEKCHLANSADIMRWAIGSNETGGDYVPDKNHCNASNNYCAATIGSPSSAGKSKFYATSYGPHQIILNRFVGWLNPGGKTRYKKTPDCIQKTLLDDPELMKELKQGQKRAEFMRKLSKREKKGGVPQATIDKDGNIVYPPIPEKIQKEAEALGLAKDQAEWVEIWQRMSVWSGVRKKIRSAWAYNGEAGSKKERKKTEAYLLKSRDKTYLALLERLNMTNDGAPKTGIAPYLRRVIFSEAVEGFANAAMFTGMRPDIFDKIMAVYGSDKCYIDMVKEHLNLDEFPEHKTHADPKDPITQRWVRKVAGGNWNGADKAGVSSYAYVILKHYTRLYNQHFGKTKVCE